MYWILFDIDGTLLSSSGAGGRAMYAAVKQLFGEELKLGSVPFHGRTDRAIITDILKFIGEDSSEQSFLNVKKTYLEILPSELAKVESQIFKGVKELLDELASRKHVRVGLLTGNTEQGAGIKLGHFGIEEYFEYGAFGDHHLSRNDVAANALEQITSRSDFDVKPENVWIVGDTPADIECGRHINAKVLAVSTGGYTHAELQSHNADILVECLSDSSEFLGYLS